MKDVLILQSDAERIPLEDGRCDLALFSPPYCDARTYGINAQRGAVEWVKWMLKVITEAQRVTKGPVICVAAGVTRERNYWPAVEGLMWEWWKLGGESQLYRPVYWHRVGIPGSGGKDWFRSDVEYCACFKRPGALPFSDNTACGHPPKWGPGGEMSHRVSNGARVNQWGHSIDSGATVTDGEFTRSKGKRPSHASVWGGGGTSFGRKPNGEKIAPAGWTKSDANGNDVVQTYNVPVLANPGNLLKTIVGGGAMGHEYAHENEAPFPEALCEFFIKSLCPVGGIVLDCFGGSGTTAATALRLCRRAISCDLRMSQCKLTERRLLNPPEKVKAYKQAEAMKAEDERAGQTSLFDPAEPPLF